MIIGKEVKINEEFAEKHGIGIYQAIPNALEGMEKIFGPGIVKNVYVEKAGAKSHRASEKYFEKNGDFNAETATYVLELFNGRLVQLDVSEWGTMTAIEGIDVR